MLVLFLWNYLFSSCLQSPQFSSNGYGGVPFGNYPGVGVPIYANQMGLAGINRMVPSDFQNNMMLFSQNHMNFEDQNAMVPNVQKEMYPDFPNTIGLDGENRINPAMQIVDVENRRKEAG